MHHANVIRRIIKGGHCRFGDESMWLGCVLESELKVLEDELVDLILLAE